MASASIPAPVETCFELINVSNVAVGLLSFSSFPLFTAALEPLLLRQRPSRVQIAAALLILPGIYLLVPSFSLEDRTTLGVAWGVLSGATFTLLSVGNRWPGRNYLSSVLSLYQALEDYRYDSAPTPIIRTPSARRSHPCDSGQNVIESATAL